MPKPDPGSRPSTAARVDEVLAGVGQRLRDVRERRGLTLAEVADELQTSASTLSRLESGSRRPTLDLLVHLSQLYQLPLDDLVGAPPAGDPRLHPRPVRRDQRIYLQLTGPAAPVQAVKLVLPGRVAGQRVETGTHPGYEWIYVLHGSVDLVIGGSVTRLETGESAEVDTSRPHGTASATDAPAELLVLHSAHGERAHLPH